MLVTTLNVPKNDRDWAVWSFANADAVRAINQAIEKQLGVTLPAYTLDPINWDRIDLFLSWNEQAHRLFTSILGQQSSDLQTVDLKDEKQLASWIELNYSELRDAQLRLQI